MTKKTLLKWTNNQKQELTKKMDKSQKIDKITQKCCTVCANGKTEYTWPMEELAILTEVGSGRSGWPNPD